MKAITLRNLPPELIQIVRQKADEQHASINKVVIGLLEKSVSVRGRKREMVLHHDLDALAGSWTCEEAAAFNNTPWPSSVPSIRICGDDTGDSRYIRGPDIVRMHED